LFSAHNSCQETFPKTGVISLSGGFKANSIAFCLYISVFTRFVNREDFSPLRTRWGYDMILEKQLSG